MATTLFVILNSIVMPQVMGSWFLSLPMFANGRGFAHRFACVLLVSTIV